MTSRRSFAFARKAPIIDFVVRSKRADRDEASNQKQASAPEVEHSWDSTIQVLERARGGDRSAARILIERAIPPLQRWTHGRIPADGRGPADTEDVVQDAVLQTLKRIEGFEHRTVGGLQAYLRAAVVNRIRDVVRRIRRRGVTFELPEDLHDTNASPLEQAIMSERFELFVEALQRLRPVDRQVIVWRIELGYSCEEIAQRLGKSNAAAARMTVSRALARLAKEMGVGAASS